MNKNIGMFLLVKKKWKTGVASACAIASFQLAPLRYYSVGVGVSVRTLPTLCIDDTAYLAHVFPSFVLRTD